MNTIYNSCAIVVVFSSLIISMFQIFFKKNISNPHFFAWFKLRDRTEEKFMNTCSMRVLLSLRKYFNAFIVGHGSSSSC